MNVPHHDSHAIERYAWHVNRCIEGPARISKHRLSVRRRLAHRERRGPNFAPASGSSGTLEEVGWARRCVVHSHHAQATDVDAHLHGGGAAQQVDLAFLELAFDPPKFGTGKLGRVLPNDIELRSPGDPVAELGPGAESSQLGDLRIACKPGLDLLRALLAGPGVFAEGEGVYGHPHGSSPGLLGAPGRGEEGSHSLD